MSLQLKLLSADSKDAKGNGTAQSQHVWLDEGIIQRNLLSCARQESQRRLKLISTEFTEEALPEESRKTSSTAYK